MEVLNRAMLRIAMAVRREDGATMVEYGIMVALIAAVCIVIITTLGGQVNDAFNSVSSGM